MNRSPLGKLKARELLMETTLDEQNDFREDFLKMHKPKEKNWKRPKPVRYIKQTPECKID